MSPPVYPSVELDAQTDSNHDTALTLACANGHTDLVSLLLSRGAEIEHRDKKGTAASIAAARCGCSHSRSRQIASGSHVKIVKFFWHLCKDLIGAFLSVCSNFGMCSNCSRAQVAL